MYARIVSDPAVLGGKPVVKGTRISVEFLLELFAGGHQAKGQARSNSRRSPSDSFGAVRLSQLQLLGLVSTLIPFTMSPLTLLPSQAILR
jgi:Protein of unknown function (DUF433)